MSVDRQKLYVRPTVHLSRLIRAENAELSSGQKIRDRCKIDGIPFDNGFESTAFLSSSADLRSPFQTAYYLPPFPDTGLREKGAGVILVMESKVDENSNHGEVVATIAKQVATNLAPDTDTVYVKASINPAYRAMNEGSLHRAVTGLLENQGAAVIHTSIGWNEDKLNLRNFNAEHLNSITAFVVDSTGNDGAAGDDGAMVPEQKNNSVSHAPPLVVHVGAAEFDANKGDWYVPGYSSKNSPTVLAPVMPHVNVNWNNSKASEAVTGTSASAPYVSGGLAALNRSYGRYLTREQILFAVLSTCDPVRRVEPFGNKTPQAENLTYIRNSAGLEYNPTYAGFGLVNFYNAEIMCAHMVERAQANHEGITTPQETIIGLKTEKDEQQNEAGVYKYTIKMPKGISLKTTFSIHFEDQPSQVSVTSPAGTEFPLVLSNPKTSFGVSTVHAWAGEQMEGDWVITSTTPIENLEIYAHHFLEKDLVNDISFAQVRGLQRPNLTEARTVSEVLTLPTKLVRPYYAGKREGLHIDGLAPDSYEAAPIFHYLRKAPPGILLKNITKKTTSIQYGHKYSVIPSDGWEYEKKAVNVKYDEKEKNNLDLRIARINFHLDAAKAYGYEGAKLEQANNLSLAGLEWLKYPSPLDNFSDPSPQNAIIYYQQAIALHEEQGHWDFVYRDTMNLYEAVKRTIKAYKEKDRLIDIKYLDLAKKIMNDFPLIAARVQGRLDEDAYRVEQGEMGFSDKDKIGCDKNDCLTIVVQPASGENKLTGVASIDLEIDLATLDKFFERFPKGKLNMRVIGARFDSVDVSIHHIAKVIAAMKDRDIDIISADVGDGEFGPASFVVDPQTFELVEAVPVKPNPHKEISNGIVVFSSNGKPLLTTLDLTKSAKRPPMLLDESSVKALRAGYLDKDLIGIDEVLAPGVTNDRPLIVHDLNALIVAYKKAYAPLETVLDKQVAILRGKGVVVEDGSIIEAKEVLKVLPLYVGEGSNKANKSLYDGVAKLFTEEGRRAVVNPAALTDIKLTPHAYDAMASNFSLHAAKRAVNARIV